MAKDELDQTILSDLKDHATQLRADHAARDSLFEKYEEMYLLNWSQKTSRKLKHMQVTASPDFRNQVQGAVRLMIATDPQVNIDPTEKTKGADLSKVERFLNQVLYQSGRLAGEPVHYPLITSGILFDEMHAAITSTKDTLNYIRLGEPGTKREKLYRDASIRRWEEIAEATPFMVEAWNPISGYPEFATSGLTAYYRVYRTTLGVVMDRFGHVPAFYQDAPRNTQVDLHTMYDEVYTAVWMDGGGLALRPHELPRIPVVVQILNGSRLFSAPEDQRQPFGYTMLKSNLWNAQNLALTAIFTGVLNEAWNPTKVYTPAQEGSQVIIDHDDDVLQLHPGDRLDFVQSKGLIDPSLREAYMLATNKGSESTIYPQALGAAAEGGATYSEVALLQQAGRLPMVPVQRRGGWGIGSICETILTMIREVTEYRAGTGLTVADVPRGMEVKVKLDVSLPQDKLQQANILNILTNPQDPKVSVAWALENILNINDPENMRRQVWNERAAEMMQQLTMQTMMQQLQQQMQQQAAQQQQQAMQQQYGQGGGPGQGMPPPGGPGEPGMPPGGPGPGMEPGGPGPAQEFAEGGSVPMAPPGAATMEGGLPQAQGGIVPGAGNIMAPPRPRAQPGGRR